jgi:hypothetical protein
MQWLSLSLVKEGFSGSSPTIPILVNRGSVAYIEPTSNATNDGCTVYFTGAAAPIKIKETLEYIRTHT